MGLYKKIVILLAWTMFMVLFPGAPLLALDPDKPLDRFLIDQWEISAGLPSDNITALAQTTDGFLWIGTDKGLVRFDGLKFELLDIDNNPETTHLRISTLFANKKNTLWIGHQKGLTRFRQGEFHTFSAKEGFPGGRISKITRDVNGSLWVGTADNFLSRREKEIFTLFDSSKGLKGKFITAVLEDSRGFLWVSTLIDGLFKFQYGKFVRVEIAGMDSRHSMHALYEDKDKHLWIGTNMGLFRCKNNSVRVFTTRDGLSDNRVNHIMADSGGSIWVGTVNGLNRITGSSSPNPIIETCFKNFYINCLLQDKEKSLWVGTTGSALKRLREGVFKTYSTENGLGHFVSCLYESSDGAVWIGTDYGRLFRNVSKTGAITEFPIQKDILDLRIRTLGEDGSGNVLVGTIRDGIFYVKKDGLEPYANRETLSGSIIQVIRRDAEEGLWVGTMGRGLFRFSRGNMNHYTISDGLPSNVILNVFVDKKNNTWVATSGGVVFLPGGNFENSKKYLEGVFILAVYEDRAGIFWFGTLGRGLVRFKAGQLDFFAKTAGLGSDNIYQILEDEHEYLWMSSDIGVLQVSKKDIERFFEAGSHKSGHGHGVNCMVYGISDGLKSAGCSAWGNNSAIKSRGGGFWFATPKGASVVYPAKLKIDKLPPPPVIIEKISVNGKSYPVTGELPRFRENKNIEIHFTAAAFTALERVKFKYRLEGFDREWIPLAPGKKRSAIYASLPVGEYTFRVTAGSSDGLWNEAGASLTFPVFSAPTGVPVYLFLLLILCGGIVFFLLRKKTRPGASSAPKYKTSTLDQKKAAEIAKKLIHLLEYEQAYLREDVSLKSLAEELAVSYHQLSQVINEQLQKNFFDLINSYRIEEAQRRLADPKEASRSILAIAFDVGFNTKAAFNRVFKKYAGMTPSQYRKAQKK
ncbi:MAG: helix-turn-helix domain-containing protein [Candidatus Aminicenantes bacterium]|nr:helix-turn-helix domain-containing protein [Candidatus Aminicenantes bacterium]